MLTSSLGLLKSNLTLIASVSSYQLLLIKLVYLTLLFPLQKFEASGIYSCQTHLCVCVHV